MDVTTLSIAQRFTKDYVQEQIKKLPQSGANDYTELENKPKINGVELDGDKTLEALGIPTGGGEWEYSQTITLAEVVNSIVIDKDIKGNPLKLTKAYIQLYSAPNAGDKAVWLNGYLDNKNILGVKEAIRHEYWTRTFMYFDVQKDIYAVANGYDFQQTKDANYNRPIEVASVAPFLSKEYISSIKFDGGLFGVGTVVYIKGVIK